MELQQDRQRVTLTISEAQADDGRHGSCAAFGSKKSAAQSGVRLVSVVGGQDSGGAAPRRGEKGAAAVQQPRTPPTTPHYLRLAHGGGVPGEGWSPALPHIPDLLYGVLHFIVRVAFLITGCLSVCLSAC